MLNDLFWAQLFLTPPLCPVTGLEYPLPCTDALFTAKTATEWSELLSQHTEGCSTTHFYEIITTILSHTQPIEDVLNYCKTSNFGRQLIIGMLFALILATRAARPRIDLQNVNVVPLNPDMFRPIQQALDRLYATLVNTDPAESFFTNVIWNTACIFRCTFLF